MDEQERFERLRTLFGTLDDLCQQRRRSYTAWATGKVEPDAFVATMTDNLARTREACETLEGLLLRRG